MTEILTPLAFISALLPLAQIQAPPMDGVGHWLWNGLGALAVIVLCLTAIVQFRKAFGRTPPLNEVLSGLATLKHIDGAEAKIKDLQSEFHTRSRGLEEQISKLRHDIHGEYNAAKLAQQNHKEEISEKIEACFREMDNRRSKGVGNLHEQLKSAEVKLAGVAASNDAMLRTVESLDAKFQRLLERLATPQHREAGK